MWTNDDTGLEKRVTSALRSGHNPVVLDEAHVLNSRSLSGALTADFWAGRILGVSTVLDVDMRQLMFSANSAINGQPVLSWPWPRPLNLRKQRGLVSRS